MNTNTHRIRFETGSARRVAFGLLVMVFVVLSAPHANALTTSVQFEQQTVVAVPLFHCPLGKRVGATECQSSFATNPAAAITRQAISPSAGVLVWRSRAALSSPDGIRYHLFRPPRFLLARF